MASHPEGVGHGCRRSLDAWREQLGEGVTRRLAGLPGGRAIARTGSAIHVRGSLVEVSAPPLPVGARCMVETSEGGMEPADVVGFDRGTLSLMPHAGIRGITRGARVVQVEREAMPAVGWGMLGRVIDGEGNPLDGRGPLDLTQRWPLLGRPVNPMQRHPVTDVLDCGVRAINALTTLGVGMRMGLFAGSGVGKSTLLGMMARHVKADIVVVALIGERGREVGEFVTQTLGSEALKRAIVIAAPADTSALSRIHAANLAAAVAEFFRHLGRNVVLMVDSLTRLAMAAREVGLASGEPPVMRAYPPSVFSLVASYIERAGQGGPGEGAITGLYTVLVEGDDPIADPVADTARATLDGHIVLNRAIADTGLYPPIDPEQSLSRVMNGLVDKPHRDAALRFRAMWARLRAKQDIVDIGAYRPGQDALLDAAIRQRDAIEAAIRQGLTDRSTYADSTSALMAAIRPAAERIEDADA